MPQSLNEEYFHNRSAFANADEDGAEPIQVDDGETVSDYDTGIEMLDEHAADDDGIEIFNERDAKDPLDFVVFENARSVHVKQFGVTATSYPFSFRDQGNIQDGEKAFSKTLVCLDVSNVEKQFTCRKTIVSLNQFAEATPNLKVFRAQRSYMVFKFDPAFGDLNNHGLWAKLEGCNISFPRILSLQRQVDFMRFLSGCIGLRRLNVSHVDEAFRTLVHWESGCRLTHLETSRSAVFDYPYISYNTLTVKEFQLSSHLVKLDLSWNTKQAVEIMLRSLADRSGMEERPLRKLDLAGTSVETGELRISTVCRLFRAAAKAPELWECVDFDTGKIKLEHKKDVLRKVSREFISPVATKYLSFANMISLEYVELMEVLSKTPALKSLNLASCHGLKPHLIFTGEIKEKCPQLQSLDLSYISNNHGLWTKLEECQISSPRCEFMPRERLILFDCQKDFMGFLSGCMSLRRLNVSHMDGAFRTLVQWKSGCRLTHLEISRSALFESMSYISYNTLTLKELSSHLAKLDLSCNAKQVVEIMLRSLADRSGMEERPLRKLDLAGTSVETGELKLYSLYAKSLPLDVTCRVWDVFLRDGEDFLFKTALGILRMNEDYLLTTDFDQCVQFLTHLPADSLNSADLFRNIGQFQRNTSTNANNNSVNSGGVSGERRKFAQILAECSGVLGGRLPLSGGSPTPSLMTSLKPGHVRRTSNGSLASVNSATAMSKSLSGLLGDWLGQPEATNG